MAKKKVKEEVKKIEDKVQGEVLLKNLADKEPTILGIKKTPKKDTGMCKE